MIGLIENSTANLPNTDMLGTSNEPNLEAPKLTPFESMPQSTQEELGKELFNDPLLSIDNVKKLADYMQWSFKYTKINLLLLLLCLSRVVDGV